MTTLLEKAKSNLGLMLAKTFIPDYWRVPDVNNLPDNPTGMNLDMEYKYPIEVKDLVATLLKYGVRCSVEDIKIGSSVTTYEILLPIGADSSKLIKRTDDLARDLGHPDLRVLSYIPGTKYMGIEVPNNVRMPVSFKELACGLKGGDLQVVLGRDTYNNPVYVDLVDAPHLLVAGTTGSGKSVWLHSVINSLLCTKTPKEVKFLLVDPKRVELKAYECLPHLAKPIAYEADEAEELLDWAVEEMDRRFLLLDKTSSKDIRVHNSLVSSSSRIPYLVFIIDEFSDLVMTSKLKKTFEDKVIRLAQKARAVGIHLILATQKPIKTVVTSLIKGNMPSRISFSVPSNMDSRVILDEGGAEKLLGKGDMLVKIGRLNMSRVQGVWISDKEIRHIIKGGL
jgi:S-DNA-T family DNA segregation ATPase FtsK/SpoIIIE